MTIFNQRFRSTYLPQVKQNLISTMINLVIGKRVVSGVAKRFKTQHLKKLGNIPQILNLGGDINQCPVSLPGIKLGNNSLKLRRKSKLFLSCPLLLDFFILFQIFCLRLQFTLSFNKSFQKLNCLSKQTLQNINKNLLCVNQQKNVASVIEWFKNVEDLQSH